MKKLIFFIVLLSMTAVLNAQTIKKVKTPKAGTLSTLLTKIDNTTLTDLTVSGVIDARDFYTMKNLAKLKNLDISNSKILAYKGKGGVRPDDDTIQYIQDEIPMETFSSSGIESITLPNTIKSIGMYAFGDCSNLKEVAGTSSLESIGEMVFNNCTLLTKFEFGKNINFIGSQSFCRCSYIKSFTFNSDKIDGVDGTTFYFCSSLKSIYVNTSKPPVFLTMPKDVFSSLITDKNNITVFVKPGTLELFKQDPNWNIFPNIIEL